MMRPTLTALLFCTAHACVNPGTNTLDLFLPYHNKNISVPPVNTDASLYAYATENALVAVPPKCLGADATSVASFMDQRPGWNASVGYGRLKTLNNLDKLATMSQCACGLVVLLHGTSGVMWQAASYAVAMAALGYVVVAPDSQAMPDSMGLKGKHPLLENQDLDLSNYCGSLNPYGGSCSSFSKPYCYSTKAENVLENTSKYQEYVERNYLIRKLELDYLVQNKASLLAAFDRVFLFGRSEGAMVASRYHHPDLDARLSGRILSGWSCEFNYFVSCAEHAKICGDQCNKEVPQLNINGQDDSYFGRLSTSVASQVANATGGYGGPITGNCRAAYNAQGFSTATVVEFPSVSHSIMYKRDDELRGVIADFLYNPQGPASSYASLNRAGCELSDGVYACGKFDNWQEPCVDYEVNNNATARSFSKEACPAPEGDGESSDASFAQRASAIGAASFCASWLMAAVAVLG